jgi:branched-chain amino acid transport system permease protein
MSGANLPFIAAISVNALVISFIYILMALGFAFLFSIMGILNFAHGSIYMVGAYICFELATSIGMNQWFALLVAVIIMGLFGIVLERVFFRPFFGNLNRTIVVCIGILTVLENGVSVLQGYSVNVIPAFIKGVVRVGIISITWERLVTLLISGILLVAVLLFIRLSKQGQQMQAIAQDLIGATLQGISVHRISALACVIACAIAAVAGSLMGAYLSLTPYMGNAIMVKVLEILVVGGVGSFNGILFAGLIVGCLDAVLPVYFSPTVSQTVALFIIIVILLIRPQGLFGQEVRS